MKNKHAFICHGGLGDMYVQLLKIKGLDIKSCDIYYRDQMLSHVEDIRILCESQSEVEKFDALRIEQSNEYLDGLKKELEKMLTHGKMLEWEASEYDNVLILDSTLTNISNIRKITLPEWTTPYATEYVTINTGAGDWTVAAIDPHNANRRWNDGELQSVVEGIATKTDLSVILIGKPMSLPPFDNKKIINESEKNIIEQINIIKHAKLNIGFEGFNLIAAMSFNKKMIVKNNPPNHKFEEKNIRYLDEEAYNNIITLDSFSPRDFLPTIMNLRKGLL